MKRGEEFNWSDAADRSDEPGVLMHSGKYLSWGPQIVVVSNPEDGPPIMWLVDAPLE